MQLRGSKQEISGFGLPAPDRQQTHLWMIAGIVVACCTLGATSPGMCSIFCATASPPLGGPIELRKVVAKIDPDHKKAY
jgi:hypothetical protein